MPNLSCGLEMVGKEGGTGLDIIIEGIDLASVIINESGHVEVGSEGAVGGFIMGPTSFSWQSASVQSMNVQLVPEWVVPWPVPYKGSSGVAE